MLTIHLLAVALLSTGEMNCLIVAGRAIAQKDTGRNPSKRMPSLACSR
jgi:hypothetical protein